MIPQDFLLVTYVKLVDRLLGPTEVGKRGRGQPRLYSDQLFLNALMMIVRHLHSLHELAVLIPPTVEITTLRELISEQAVSRHVRRGSVG